MKSNGMSIPTQKPLDHKHPRWLLHTAAWCFALVYSGLFVGANIWSRLCQTYGWPFIYMVRETRPPSNPGELHNIYYDPWPFYSAPLVSFEPMWLVLNILCGIVLTCLAAAIALYWLHLCQRPLQFTLRSILGLVIVVACLLGLFTFFAPSHFSNLLQMALLIIWLAQLCVYIVPFAFLATVAHRAVWNRKRRRSP